MKRLLMSAAAALLLPGAALAVPQVFLVQNSGWMEPFFSDPSSQYKALVTEVMLAATEQGDAVVLASFNQSQPGAPSPKALLSERADGAQLRQHVAAALSPLGVAKKPGSGALADTDLGEAVSAAIGTALENKPGLVWLFTNNKNSPNNDQATAARNREFYELIHHGGAIRKALAFPLHMPVKGKTYSANGLMVYVFAIHGAGAAQLDALLRSGRLRQVITETPARLKPLDQDTVRLRPVRVENVPGVAFSTLPNGMLRADVDAGATAAAQGGSAPAARIGWQLENAIYPYTIVSAHLDAASALAGERKAIALGSDSVRALVPGKPQPLSSSLQLPVAQLPGKWSLAAVKAAGSAQLLPGRVEVRLSEQKLELSQAFRQRMAALFPGDPLPDIFTPPERIQGSRAVLPVEVRVNYGIAPLLAALGLVGALLALAAGLVIALTRGRKVRLVVEGEPRTIHTKPGMRTPIHDKAGNKVAELHTTLFASTLNDLREGAQVRLEK
ncbi:hypothetical protein [Pseudoduganella violacea]|uniref:VWA domain-containing protein n=1 Tax=Pseudoduganella violacea TaxID=1715466 RepID=A0A7W5B7I4_9BURK|nr:hypothetical protein [Pseudoduganella violacea]MBB3117957.1 hypothetical protein [Pseudoduganella violacea]